MRNGGEDTVSTNKNKLQLLLICTGLVIFAIGLLILFFPFTKSISFGTKRIFIESATSDEQKQRGLSGRASLSPNHGMLFFYQDEGINCFWMKNMNFPLDILWLDSNKKVVDIRENVSPDTYPKIFCPSEPAKYVLEVSAGLSKQSGVSIGKHL